ncbi:ATP-binding protein [Candidatus Marsarchaeota archaeon]|nr:ATP-binding protein [Candidatus Marsarchaeota archaeon]
MNEEEILTVLLDWNFWGNGLDTGIERKYYVERVQSLLNDVNIVPEIGIRRCGKSYIGRQVIKARINKGLNKKSTLIIDLNDERFQKDNDILNAVYAAYRKNINNTKKTLILIDEPQEIEGWEKFVRGISERGEAKFIVTGSSSKLLNSEFSTLLSGRHIPISVFPLSFAEFLIFKKINAYKKIDIARNLLKIHSSLDEYIFSGGFPAVVKAGNKMELLNSYLDTILVKDITSRYNIRRIEKLKVLSKFYLTNISSSITYNSISKFTKLPVKTIERFSGFISNAFLLFFVPKFSFSLKEQENSARKVYAIDHGIAVASGINTALAKGALVENIVAVELKRRNKEFYYWKDSATGKEVDFVVKNKDSDSYLLIQVSLAIESPDTMNREISALESAMKSFKKTEALLITYSKPEKGVSEHITKKGIKIKSLWEWLLE